MKRDKKLKKLVGKLEDAVKMSNCQAPSPHIGLISDGATKRVGKSK